MLRFAERGTKSDAIAFALGSFLAIGSFVLVVVFTWLQKMHHTVSVRTPCFALLIAFASTVAATVFFGESEYWRLIVGDWVAIIFFCLLSLAVCRRWYKS